ncbi:hypothetical protein CFRS1_v005501 [Colletotrichum fructicola]|nr:hypothetical protein CFRS1_v005501 [Colletotrichum fructicola]
MGGGISAFGGPSAVIPGSRSRFVSPFILPEERYGGAWPVQKGGLERNRTNGTPSQRLKKAHCCGPNGILLSLSASRLLLTLHRLPCLATDFRRF